MKDMKAERSITIRVNIELAETIEGLIDSCIGTSADETFNKELKPFLRRLSKAIAKKRDQLRSQFTQLTK